jgi:hypothetical protein
MPRVRYVGGPGVAALIAILCFSPGAFAAGVVSSANESALLAAMAGGGRVTFGFNGTIYLSDAIDVSTNTVLDATGQTVAISGSSSVQLFTVNSGATLCLTNLTLEDGLALVGAISNGGVLQATRCRFINNGAYGLYADPLFPSPPSGSGGAVYNSGFVSLSECTFSANWATGWAGPYPSTGLPAGSANGGAIYNEGSAFVVDCSFSGNYCIGGAGAEGGTYAEFFWYGGGGGSTAGAAIESTSRIMVSNCAFVGNYAIGGNGGQGSSNFAYFPSVASGFAGGNAGQASGGGLDVQSGTANVINSTFWDNSCQGGVGGAGGAGQASGYAYEAGGQGGNGGRGGAALGGAICNIGGSLYLTNLTISSNMIIAGEGGPGGAGGKGGLGAGNGPNGANGATGSPEGESLGTSSGSTTLKNSILVANSLTDTNIFGDITDAGNNISYDSQESLTNASSLNGVNPKLAPLGNFGGPTPTMALLAGSPAIDAADPTAFPATDQRGRPRPYGPKPDIGAYEYSPIIGISGQVTGLMFADQATVTAGSYSTLTTNGAYSLSVSDAPSYTVSAFNSNYVIVPATETVPINSYQLTLNFQAYRMNAITLGAPSANALNLSFAGSSGQQFTVESTTNFMEWTPIATNTVGAAGYGNASFFMTNMGGQFFRLVSPP